MFATIYLTYVKSVQDDNRFHVQLQHKNIEVLT